MDRPPAPSQLTGSRPQTKTPGDACKVSPGFSPTPCPTAARRAGVAYIPSFFRSSLRAYAAGGFCPRAISKALAYNNLASCALPCFS